MNEDFIVQLKELIDQFDITKCDNCSSCSLHKIVLETNHYGYREYDICDLLEKVKEYLD